MTIRDDFVDRYADFYRGREILETYDPDQLAYHIAARALNPEADPDA